MKRIGFTGTQNGMTPKQRESVRNLLREHIGGGPQFHHGDCVGADEQAAKLAKDLRFYLYCHPPINSKLRAWVSSDYAYSPKDYLVRNRNIVDFTDFLIAAPKGPEQLRSGTWSTIRYAKKQGKLIMICWPNGKIEELK